MSPSLTLTQQIEHLHLQIIFIFGLLLFCCAISSTDLRAAFKIATFLAPNILKLF